MSKTAAGKYSVALMISFPFECSGYETITDSDLKRVFRLKLGKDVVFGGVITVAFFDWLSVSLSPPFGPAPKPPLTAVIWPPQWWLL
jgi:hypothetical protein